MYFTDSYVFFRRPSGSLGWIFSGKTIPPDCRKVAMLSLSGYLNIFDPGKEGEVKEYVKSFRINSF